MSPLELAMSTLEAGDRLDAEGIGAVGTRQWFERSIHSGGWPGFGFIVSEVELRRVK